MNRRDRDKLLKRVQSLKGIFKEKEYEDTVQTRKPVRKTKEEQKIEYDGLSQKERVLKLLDKWSESDKIAFEKACRIFPDEAEEIPWRLFHLSVLMGYTETQLKEELKNG